MSARPVALLVLIVLAAPLFSGCVGVEEFFSPADDAVDKPATSTADNNGSDLPASNETAAGTGSVRVLALTPDLDPVAEAEVAMGDNTSGRTADDGRLVIPGIPAGDHNLVVRKENWRSAMVTVTVVADETVDVTAKLLPGEQAAAEDPPSNESYQIEYDFTGNFQCSLTYVIIVGDCLLIADFLLNDTLGLPVSPGENTDDVNAFEFPLDAGWESVVVEMVWDAPLAPMGEKMQLALEPSEAPEDGHAAKYARVTGGSPLSFVVQNGEAHETASASADGEEPDMPNPAGGEIVTARAYVLGEAHNPGGTNFLGIGAAYSQKFDIYVTIFYGEAAPEDFSRIPA